MWPDLNLNELQIKQLKSIKEGLQVHIAGEKDIEKLIPVIRELRKHRTDAQLRKKLSKQMKDRFEVIFIGDEKTVYAMAGFRTMEVIFSGKTLYVDDLITHPDHRQKGYGGALLRWMIQYAKANHYDHFSLDSGPERKKAQRLYLKHGLEGIGAHFAKDVKDL
jgi:ribosomal protein S18 acetylase RimI-like enzyme